MRKLYPLVNKTQTDTLEKINVTSSNKKMGNTKTDRNQLKIFTKIFDT